MLNYILYFFASVGLISVAIFSYIIKQLIAKDDQLKEKEKEVERKDIEARDMMMKAKKEYDEYRSAKYYIDEVEKEYDEKFKKLKEVETKLLNLKQNLLKKQEEIEKRDEESLALQEMVQNDKKRFYNRLDGILKRAYKLETRLKEYLRNPTQENLEKVRHSKGKFKAFITENYTNKFTHYFEDRKKY